MAGLGTGVLEAMAPWSGRPWTAEARQALFAKVAEEATPALYRTALALLGNPADAEDAVQEALLKGFRSLSAFRRDSDIRTWLYRITINLCRDAGRRTAANRRLFARLAVLGRDESDPAPQPSEVAEWSATGQELSKLLASLDSKYRLPLVLKHVAGRSVREIAATLGVPEGTIKRRLHEAYHRLRATLTKGGEWNGQ